MKKRIRGTIGSGTMAGLAATVPMTVVMAAAERAGWMTEMPPRRIARHTIDEVPGASARGAGLPAATIALHLGVGAGGGIAYALLTDHPRLQRVPAVARGVAFGTALWAMAYLGILPAMGLMPPATRDERRRPMAMLVAHWVYGVTLAILVRRIDHARPGR